MSAATEVPRISPQERDIHTPYRNLFPHLLRRAQNPDGGWGYRQGLQSSTEPTAWCILALLAHEGQPDEVISSACEFLRNSQMGEGAWPTSSGKEPGCWVTALACLALANAAGGSNDAVARGTKWLCESWPAEGNLLWRLRQLRQEKSSTVVHQDHSLRGWGWTPNTASWVEPTAYVMILLEHLSPETLPQQAGRRMHLAEQMLYDRACPGGGWNAGNPLVYGVPGVPRTGPTVWALLALRRHPQHSAVVEGLNWLEANYRSPRSPAALALTQLCLNAFNRPTEPIEGTLYDFYRTHEFLHSIPVVAWASLALSGVPRWLGPPSQARGAR